MNSFNQMAGDLPPGGTDQHVERSIAKARARARARQQGLWREAERIARYEGDDDPWPIYLELQLESPEGPDPEVLEHWAAAQEAARQQIAEIVANSPSAMVPRELGGEAELVDSNDLLQRLFEASGNTDAQSSPS